MIYDSSDFEKQGNNMRKLLITLSVVISLAVVVYAVTPDVSSGAAIGVPSENGDPNPRKKLNFQ